jgi:hypothetical protein
MPSSNSTNAPNSVAALRRGDWKFYLPVRKKAEVEQLPAVAWLPVIQR